MQNIIRNSICGAIAACASVVLGAQTPSTPQTSTPSPTADEAKVVVTGCLKEAPPNPAMPAPTATGTTGTTSPAAPPVATDTAATPTYVLTNASVSPADASTSSAQTYRLIANASALTPHVGKKLELTGVIEKQAGAAPGSESPAAASASGPALRVQSGKIVANSCSE